MLLPHVDVCGLLLNRTHGNMESICFIHKNIQLQLFISKSFSITRKPAFAHFGKREKQPFDVICCLYVMKQSHWMLCITRSCDWSRKITPLSNLIQMASLCTSLVFLKILACLYNSTMHSDAFFISLVNFHNRHTDDDGCTVETCL